ncbi:enterochelin esterase family protein [Kribbella voronezhensis]|uniref:Enterochelin esterase family protein n=1 Tax=Kribbella voronezhensis TaxID=2512212 RepID=A0A4R7TAT2_9ACTN|nr:alpha/beta hydrolase-fold protein [Kribbella voronezhensis]TDU89065.1 enterochelin esterase family protein [Kribbella voronezhensis]
MSETAVVSAVEGAEVVFRLADPEHALHGVRLWEELGIAAELLEFKPVDYGWELRLPRPSVHRMEYLFDIADAGMRTDPTNPRVVGGAFGEHSWLPLPGYVEPRWIDIEPIAADVTALPVDPTPVGQVDVEVWAPSGIAPSFELPLLVSHDGPEFAAYAGLTHYTGAMVADGTLPPFRLALVRPTSRNLWYAANPQYAEALTQSVLPAVTSQYKSKLPVLMGASLGALAALYAEWNHPGTFAGLFLQSGSFFTLSTDPQEAKFEYYAEVTAFVNQVLAATEPPSRPAIAMTAGTPEENVHNNRVMAAHLTGLGLRVAFDETPDMHNFTAWRDVLDPCLTGLLRRTWSEADGT